MTALIFVYDQLALVILVWLLSNQSLYVVLDLLIILNGLIIQNKNTNFPSVHSVASMPCMCPVARKIIIIL